MILRSLLRKLDHFARSNIYLYILIRKSAVQLSRYFLLEDGFSFLKLVETRQSSLALDIGSNDGTSIEMILKTIPSAHIVSVDPIRSPKRLRAQVEYRELALSDQDGLLEIHSPWFSSYHLSQYSSVDPNKVVKQLSTEFNLDPEQIRLEKVRATAVTLDSLNLIPFFIKIDVEGHEENVIRGATSTISKALPVILVEVQDSHSYQRISSLLDEMSYFHFAWPQAAREMDFSKMGSYLSHQNNYIFLPKSKSLTWNLKPTIGK